jgi:GNAT superfamily N-acetyltransferase
VTTVVELGSLVAADVEPIVRAFAEIGWNKPAAQYERYLREEAAGDRRVFVAREHDRFAGYVTIAWRPSYAPFRAAGIPEIQDLNVLPPRQRRGIATRLLDAAEAVIAARASIAGIGVGMTAAYGAAQRLYVRRGYVPDGRGLVARGAEVRHGDTITVDDDLVLYLTKAFAR